MSQFRARAPAPEHDAPVSTLREMCEELQRATRDRGEVLAIMPTRLEYRQGRIVRFGPFNWGWVGIAGDRWRRFEGHWTRAGAVRAHSDLPTAPGWAHWHVLRPVIEPLLMRAG